MTQSSIMGGLRKNLPQAARCWNWVSRKESSVLVAQGNTVEHEIRGSN